MIPTIISSSERLVRKRCRHKRAPESVHKDKQDNILTR